MLRRLLAAATAPELDLGAYNLAAGCSAGGGQVVAAGWHAAAVAARLCGGPQQRLQDALVARGLLPPLAAFVQAQPPPAPPALPGTAAAGLGLRPSEVMMAVRCEVAGLLRSLSMRLQHHAALRACPGLLPFLAGLLQPGAPGWAELKAAARKILQVGWPWRHAALSGRGLRCCRPLDAAFPLSGVSGGDPTSCAASPHPNPPTHTHTLQQQHT